MNRKFAFLLVAFNVFSSVACERGPSTYALLTMRHDETRINVVAVMELSSEAECAVASQEFSKGFLEGDELREWRETERACQQELEPIYQRVMNKEKFHATYLILSPKHTWKYETRLVLFGVPSSQAQPVCEQMAKDMEEDLEAEAECVQGTIG
jgi:hypothetical protein